MLILKPIPHRTIWGGSLFSKYFDGEFGSVGHLYSVFDSNGESSLILNKNQTLHEYFSVNKSRFGLERYKEFPLIIAMLDASDNLSIQVHPDDNLAREMESAQYGKNESWYFLRAPRSGKIFNGSKIKSKDEIQNLLQTGRGSEISDEIEIHDGDYIYIPAGTLHSLTAGSIIYEIEENSEYTYRFYDFDRVDSFGNKRQLHIEKALRALNVDNKSTVKKYDKSITERMYVTNLLENVTGYKNDSDMLDCVTIMDENFDTTLENVRIRFGMSLILEPEESVELSASKIMSARILKNA